MKKKLLIISVMALGAINPTVAAAWEEEPEVVMPSPDVYWSPIIEVVKTTDEMFHNQRGKMSNSMFHAIWQDRNNLDCQVDGGVVVCKHDDDEGRGIFAIFRPNLIILSFFAAENAHCKALRAASFKHGKPTYIELKAFYWVRGGTTYAFAPKNVAIPGKCLYTVRESD
jgi:hypothetical protein